MTDTETAATVARRRLTETFVRMSIARETAEQARTDARYVAAAASLVHIAETMDIIGDDVLAMLASVDETSHGMLSTLIMARLSEVGFALPCYVDAKEFFEPIEAQVGEILRRAHQRLN